MTVLDEKIAALFRKSSPISAGAEPTPSVDRPIAEKAESDAVVTEPAGEDANATWVDDQPTSAPHGTLAEQTSSDLHQGKIGNGRLDVNLHAENLPNQRIIGA